MEPVSQTLYIPLYGKAFVSRRGILLQDRKAEAIWDAVQFPLKGKSASKWLAYYMGMRAAVFDRWLRTQMDALPHAVVLHIGCGMDSRVLRVGTAGHTWYDVDFPTVIEERLRHYTETEEYRMIKADVREDGWLTALPKSPCAIVVMEGVSMYLRPQERTQLFCNLSAHFGDVRLLTDCYTAFAAKASRRRNPVREVGVTTVYGLEDPSTLEDGTGFAFTTAHRLTPPDLIDELTGLEKRIFKTVYAGRMSDKLYRLYEYRTT